MKVIKTKKGRQIKLGNNIYKWDKDCNHFSDNNLLQVAHNHFLNEMPFQLDWQAVYEESKSLQLEEVEKQFNIFKLT